MNNKDNNRYYSRQYSGTIKSKIQNTSFKSALKSSREIEGNSTNHFLQPTDKTDLFINQNRMTSNLSRQSSIQISKSHQKKSNNNFKWVSNENQVMDFIMNLKSKKSGPQQKKNQFQINKEKRQDKAYSRVIIIKKIEKHEKQAVKYFYEKQYNKCFTELEKAEEIMYNQKIQSVHHNLYLNYLYTQFTYKLQDFDKMTHYLQKAIHIVKNLSTQEHKKLVEYVMNVRALEICFKLQQENYQQVLALVANIDNREDLSNKIKRRIGVCEVQALKKLKKYSLSIAAIQKQIENIEKDEQLCEQKKNHQISRLIKSKIQSITLGQSVQNAITFIERLIDIEDDHLLKSGKNSYCNTIVFEQYISLLKKTQDFIKLIYVLQIWSSFESSAKEKLKIQLQLFKLYFNIGSFTCAIELFYTISTESIVYLGPEYLFMLVQIKLIQGEVDEANRIMAKIIDISEDNEKIQFILKFLQIGACNEETKQQYENWMDKLLTGKENIYPKQVESYIQYLKDRGQFEKANIMTENLMKRTATFKSENVRPKKLQ